jgi:hypothetical protein
LLRRGLRGVTNEESHFGHRGNPKRKFIHLVIRLRYLNMYGKHEKNMGKPHSSSFSFIFPMFHESRGFTHFQTNPATWSYMKATIMGQVQQNKKTHRALTHQNK